MIKYLITVLVNTIQFAQQKDILISSLVINILIYEKYFQFIQIHFMMIYDPFFFLFFFFTFELLFMRVMRESRMTISSFCSTKMNFRKVRSRFGSVVFLRNSSRQAVAAMTSSLEFYKQEIVHIKIIIPKSLKSRQIDKKKNIIYYTGIN